MENIIESHYAAPMLHATSTPSVLPLTVFRAVKARIASTAHIVPHPAIWDSMVFLNNYHGWNVNLSTNPMVAVAGPPLRFRNKRIAEPKCCWGGKADKPRWFCQVMSDMIKILTSIAKMDWNVFKTHGLLYLGGDLEPTRETNLL